ncbi:MAG TPA: hypothetical protein VFL59_17045 [Candidatus Nanopelagicales bacterium]|nr:hypothetical protein [Candidatus Nanopelagicales bacterium]
MSAAPAPFRVVRGTLVATVGLLLSATAHGLASAGAVPLGALGIPTALLVLVGCVVASSRAWTPARLVCVLGGIQVVVHTALVLGTPSGSVDPRLAGVAAASVHHGHAHAEALTPAMVAAHGAAVLLAALMLARVDVAVRVLWHLTRRLLSRDLAAALPVRPLVRVPVDALARRIRSQVLDLGTSRRGPPLLPARA